MNAAVRVENAIKVYGEGDTRVTALDDLTVSFERGKFTAIMGPSGSGKSTLLHCVAGLDSLTGGCVYIGDVCLNDLSDKALTLLRREKVGFIFQSFNLIPTLDAAENITLPIDIAGKDADPAWYDTVVDTVGLRDRLTHRPSELSGGQQQRVAIARAIVGSPKILLADEPTGNLDSKNGDEVMAQLKALNAEGTTIIMVTHSEEYGRYGSRLVRMLDGRVLSSSDHAAAA